MALAWPGADAPGDDAAPALASSADAKAGCDPQGLARPGGPGGRRAGVRRKKFRAFADEEKRALARRFVEWAQDQAMQHYRFDDRQDLAGDEWPTTKDLFDKNGDDCDGIDL